MLNEYSSKSIVYYRKDIYSVEEDCEDYTEEDITNQLDELYRNDKALAQVIGDYTVLTRNYQSFKHIKKVEVLQD
jgi:hypothetical protein